LGLLLGIIDLQKTYSVIQITKVACPNAKQDSGSCRTDIFTDSLGQSSHPSHQTITSLTSCNFH